MGRGRDRVRVELSEAEEAAGEAAAAAGRAAEARAAADEMEATIGAPLREIRRRIELAEERATELRRAEQQLERPDRAAARRGWGRRAGRGGRGRSAGRARTGAGRGRDRAGRLAEVPGLLESGVGPGPQDPPSDVAGSEQTAGGVAAALGLARGFTAGAPVPAPVLSLARRLGGLPEPVGAGTDTAVYAAWQDAVSGPAGDVDPRVVDERGALAVHGRDDTGEHPIGVLAQRLAAAVARDADLLTERERRLFEEHILGDLGESLRARRLEAEELVADMNTQLNGVTTSQGIRSQLRWTLREDVAADARRAVELLGRPVGALLPG